MDPKSDDLVTWSSFMLENAQIATKLLLDGWKQLVFEDVLSLLTNWDQLRAVMRQEWSEHCKSSLDSGGDVLEDSIVATV